MDKQALFLCFLVVEEGGAQGFLDAFLGTFWKPVATKGTEGIGFADALKRDNFAQMEQNKLPKSIGHQSVLVRLDKRRLLEGALDSVFDLFAHSVVGWDRTARRRPVPFCLSDQIEAIIVHDLGPSRHKVAHKFFGVVILCIDFCNGPQDRVRPKDQVSTRGGEFEITGGTIP